MSETATVTFFGLDSTVAPAVFGLLGSLVGASAAIGAQWLSQAATNKRETDARVRRERRVRKLFGARVRTLAFHTDMLAHLAHSDWANAETVSSVAKDTLDTLVSDFDNNDLLLSLEPETIQGFGERLPRIQLVFWLVEQAFTVPLVEPAKQRMSKALESVLVDANVLLRSLGEQEWRLLGELEFDSVYDQ